MKMRSIEKFTYTLLTALLFCNSATSYVDNLTVDQYSGKSEMNGYSFSSFNGFEKKWHLVTVRYRTDNSEIRFVYANPKAWATLQSGKTNYPDGSIFAKIAYKSTQDPIFPSSLVPTQTRRYQFMTKNSQRHVDTDGWGYALFDSSGKTFAENPTNTTLACAACHRIAEPRGFVFSTILNSEPLIKKTQKSDEQTNSKPTLKFKLVAKKDLKEPFLSQIKDLSEIVMIDSDLDKHVFQGTLNEIIPSLIAEARRTNRATSFSSKDYKKFVIVLPQSNSCPNKKPGFKIIQTTLTTEKNGDFKTKSDLECDN